MKITNILLTLNHHSQVGSSIGSMTKKMLSIDDGFLSTNPYLCRVEAELRFSVTPWVRSYSHFGVKNLSNQNPWLLPHPNWTFWDIRGYPKLTVDIKSVVVSLAMKLWEGYLTSVVCKIATIKYLYHRCELNVLMHVRHWNMPCTQ